MKAGRSPLVRFLLLLSLGVSMAAAYPFRPPPDLDVTPRVTIFSSSVHSRKRFASPPAVNYSTLSLEADGRRLFIGAREAAFSLDASDIEAVPALTIVWEASPEQKQQCLLKGKDNKTECFNHIRFLQRFNATHLYMCGTYAFRPLCAYIDTENFLMSRPEEGRDKCPYGPTTGYTGLIVDQELFTASQYEFRRFPDIRRNSPTLKTEDAPTRWLNEANFVGSALVRESRSTLGDDDKIYFFFNEGVGQQQSAASGAHSRVARVARICKGDRGGLLTLQKRWTSFLKVRLACSLPEYDFYFNELRSIFVMPGDATRDTLFYAIFGLGWKSVKASALCRFSLSDIQDAFGGPYMETQDSGSNWKEYTGKIPEPRPGTCMTDATRARGINVSTSLPDDVLNFVRRHPLMSRQVQALDRHPLLFRRTTDYTHMAVIAVLGLDGLQYHVLYMGTDEGWLHKAVLVETQLHIIEELQLFEEAQPVDNVLISVQQMSVYVGSPSGVLQLPLSDCGRYASCYDCILARDPHCAWSREGCVDVTHYTDKTSLIQDIQQGNRGCDNTQDVVPTRSRSVRVGDDILLQCELSSNLAVPAWTLDDRELHGYGLSSGFRTGTDGLLVIRARLDQSGRYTCYAVENQIWVGVVAYNVTVAPEPPPPPTEEPHHRYAAAVPPAPSEEAPALAPQRPRPQLLSTKNMEALYLSLITILGSLCVVLSVVLFYLGFCLRVGNQGKYSLRNAAATYPPEKQNHRKKQRHSAHLELKTISGNGHSICNGVHSAGFLQIVPGEARTSPNAESAAPPPAPPLPAAPDCNFPSGLSATLPSVLRRMNGNSYVLLAQSDGDSVAPSFSDELNRMLEKRKRTQLMPRPDESSV
ncbi:semaphorin-4G [Corythoichthys intestinalis]|uniref:semaphorin-4G n=1 Tax=Corythoichthys intestinalis TaxID=161448 RepID=UPI0025A5B74A|nr:semaphorin-4G [Corythoichthys intestinalis]XP_057704247.1 semaphorin-4G [Corythoichthys intestinalis]XP_057704248.1 semaphorin-4G [Corythoichthys intestinalis]XP_061794265.1 semaphorin-4G-like [Nerophis lumbriciformis]